MVGSEFIDFITKWNIPHYVSVEDFADKWNFLFTPCILIICSLVVTVKQYLLKPITCFLATHPNGNNYLSYMENICWVQGTHPIPVNGHISNKEEQWEHEPKLQYYQWVPFILGLQTVLFYVPRVVWLMIVTNRTGTDVQHMVTHASEAAQADGEKRDKIVRHIAASLEHMLFMHREYRSGRFHSLKQRIFRKVNLLIASKRLGTGLTIAYLMIKLLYLTNSIGQIYLMQRFLSFGTNYTGLFGVQILTDIAAGRDWQYTMVFPRVTFCRVKVAVLGNTNSYLGQCALPVNMLNEKIYIFLWFWIAIGSIITAVSMPVWLCRIANRSSRSRFVRRFLKLMDDYEGEKKLVETFVVEFLRHDGTFILKMMQLNAGDLVTGDIVHTLFNLWKNKHQGRDLRYDPVRGQAHFPVRVELENGGTARRPGRSGKRPAPNAPLYSSPIKSVEQPLMKPPPAIGGAGNAADNPTKEF